MTTCQKLASFGCGSDEKLVYLFLYSTLRREGKDLWTEGFERLEERIGMEGEEVTNAISKLILVGAIRAESGGLYIVSGAHMAKEDGYSTNTPK